MSFVCEGVTHCSKCGKILKMNEYGMCKECEPLNKTYGIKRLSRGSFAIFGEEHIPKINKAFDEDNRNILFEEIMESIKKQRKSLDGIEEIIKNITESIQDKNIDDLM